MADRSHRLTTLPNMLGVARIAATPVVVALLLVDAQWSDLAAAALFFLAGVTDLLDGRIARARNEVTPLGVFMDLAADKVLVAGVLVAMVEVDLVPAWMAGTLLVRELVVQAIRQLAAAESRVMSARALGKLKTLATLGGMFILMLARGVADAGGADAADVLLPAGFGLMLLATALAVLSGVLYLRDAWPLLTGHGYAPTVE